IPEDDLLRTFNCGIGMTLAVARKDAEQVEQILKAAGETVYRIGEITAGTGRVDIRP
ncbi:MAG: phosphoribosylformylglycinamidine cyclo-ligase, partial [Gammaproteobacteria bacterium]|nr:phosphoribosylformylglycinamidine cyclo-ligase [Gammaproteobacteria bacterium]